MPSPNYKRSVLRLNLILALIEGLGAFWKSLAASEEGSALVWGYSPSRLILLVVEAGILAALSWVFLQSFKKQNSPSFIENLFSRTATFWILLLAGGAAYFLIFAENRLLLDFAPYRDRLASFLTWIGLICLQSLAAFLHLRAIGSGLGQKYRDSLRPAGLALASLLILILFIALTRIGLTPDAIYWQGPGVPLLIAQVFLAWAVGLGFHALALRWGLTHRVRLDAMVCIIVWALALLLWWNQPARLSYNVFEPGPPNFQSYPFGDAFLYDTTAHEFLAGTALPNDFWIKPLYSFFLAMLHLLAGESYSLLVFLQIFVLAAIPALVYLLVSQVGNRPSGIIASLLVILREKNSIALANVIQVSHLKLLLSDVFTMGLMVLLLWLLFRWFERPDRRRDTLLILGGALGSLTLTRGHPILLLPILAIVIFMVRAARVRERWARVGMFAAGLALVLLPWVWRIHETTGRFGLQSPVSPYSANIAGIYSMTPRLANPGTFTTEISEETLARSDLQNRQVLEFMLQHPGEVARFVSAHFFHNTVYSYIYLPQSFHIDSLRNYAITAPFWGAWQGELPLESRFLLVLNMGLLALGMGAAWRKHKLLALVPLLIGAGYNASVSVGRLSGWRFILPADWISLVYLSIGLMQIGYMVWFIVARPLQDVSVKEETQPVERSPIYWFNAAAIALLFLSLGSAVTYGNRLFSERYPQQSGQLLIGEYLSTTETLERSFSESELKRFLQSENAVIVYGQAIFPYFLKTDSGPVNHAWPAYKPRPYARVVFYLVGPEAMHVILPIPSAGFDLPDGADVIVLGCANDSGDVEALSILLVDPPSLLARDPMPEPVCPLPEPK